MNYQSFKLIGLRRWGCFKSSYNKGFGCFWDETGLYA